MKNKYISILIILTLLISIMPVLNTGVNAFSSEQDFFNYLDSQGIPKRSYNGLSANWNTYETYNLIVYGNPFGDTRYSSETGRTEYRYLGYTVNDEKFDNTFFPNDVTGSKPPEEWNYINVELASESWRDINDNIKNYMRTATLTGNGATSPSFNVNYIEGSSTATNKTKVLSVPSWKNGFSIYTLNKGINGTVYYASFNGASMGGATNVNGTITTPSDNYTIKVDEDSITIPVTLTANASLSGYATVDQIKILKAEYKGNSKSINKETSVGLTTNDTISRSNLKVGNNTVTLKGTVYLESTLSADDIYIKTVTKDITIYVEAKDEPYVDINAKTDPSSVKFNNMNIPVTINIDSELKNYSNASNISSWVIYAKESDNTDYQTKTIAGSSLTSGTSFNFTIPASKVTGDEYTQEYKITSRVYLKDNTSYEATTYVSTHVYTAVDGEGTAEIYCADTIKAGDELFVIGVAMGLEEPVNYYWNFPRANNISLLNNWLGTIWYPSSAVGLNNIYLSVIGSNGYALAFKGITVLEPTLEAKITYVGTLKENRKVTITGENSKSPKYYPVNWATADWTITPFSGWLTEDDIKLADVNIDGKKDFDVLFKKAGEYKITLSAINEAGYFDYTEIIYEILPDQTPIADFLVVTTVYRDFNNYNKATIKLTNKSYSNDYDILDKMTVYYKYDSNNNGSFNDEVLIEVYKGDYIDYYEFDVPEVGKYLVELEVVERFGQATLEEFIIESDYKKSNTFNRPDIDKTAIVDNLSPIADLTIQQSDEVNLIFDLAKTNYDSAIIESYINSTLYPTLKSNNINVNYIINDIEIPSYAKMYSGGRSSASIFIQYDDSVFSWGHNTYGNLGLGHSDSASVFEKVKFDFSENKPVKIVVGTYTTLILLEDGRLLWCGFDSVSNIPTYVMGGETGTTYLEGVKDIAILDYGAYFRPVGATYYAILDDDRVVSWGLNNGGRIGDGTEGEYMYVEAPVYVVGGETGTQYLEGVKNIVTNVSSIYAHLNNDRVVAWGSNYLGHGKGSSASYVPVYVVGGETGTQYLEGVKKITTNFSPMGIFAILENKRVVTWGSGMQGILGTGNTTSINSPTYVKGGETGTQYLEGVKDINSKGYNSIAVLENGRVVTWGSNSEGQLGNNSSVIQTTTPVYVVGGETGTQYLENAVNIEAGEWMGVTLNNGRLVTWGRNTYGQLGNGTTTNSKVPVYVRGGETGTEYLQNVKDIATGSPFYTYILTEESVFRTGSSSYDTSTPKYFVVGKTIRKPIENGKKITVDTSGNVTLLTDNRSMYFSHTYFDFFDLFPNKIVTESFKNNRNTFLLIDGKVYSYSSYYVYNGIGGTSSAPYPPSNYIWANSTGTQFLNNVKKIDGYGALLETGRVATWGMDNEGQLGDGSHYSSDNRTYAGYVKGGETGTTYLEGVKDIVCVGDGELYYALLNDGRVVTWGKGNNLPRYVNVTNIEKINKINYTYTTILAKTTGGNLYSLHGHNGIARNIIETVNIAGKVADLFDGGVLLTDNRAIIAPTDNTFVFIKGGETGTLYLEGVKIANNNIGNNGTAILDNGRVVTWGNNSYGQLGNGTTINSNIPVYVRGGITGTQYLEGVKEAKVNTTSGYFILESGDVLYTGYDYSKILGSRDTNRHLTPINLSIKMDKIPVKMLEPLELYIGLENAVFPKGSDNFYVYVNDIATKELQDNIKRNNVLTSLQTKGVNFIGFGTSKNTSQLDNLITLNNNNGLYISNIILQTAFEELTDYINNMIIDRRNQATIDNYITIDEVAVFDTFYYDEENDPIKQEIWKFNHVNPNYFENSLGIFPDSNKELLAPVSKFDYVGKYEVTYKVQDNPKDDYRFDNYKKWSNESNSLYTLYVHRRPVADFSVKAYIEGVTIKNNSYDLDHISSANKGIVEEKWKWKLIDDTNWTMGKITEVEEDKVYLISLQVKDIEGCLSYENIKVLDTSDLKNLLLSASFIYKPETVYEGDTINFTNTSYYTGQVSFLWTIIEPNGTTYTRTTRDILITNSKAGKYSVNLKIYDDNDNFDETGYLDIYVLDLNVMGFVQHTEQWNINRIKYNRSISGTDDQPRGYDVFFPGEKFILKADTLGNPDSVLVEILGTSYSTNLTYVGNDIWTGFLWNNDMMRWRNLDLIFRFTAYANGKSKYYDVPIKIIDEDYWQQHRLY